MSEKLHFYTNPMSRGRIVRWMLEEVGEPYETTILDYATTMKAADFLALNPMGKVPAIKHGETIVTECAAICAYLAEAFPKANVLPTTGARGDYFRWLFFAAGPLEAAITNRSLGVTVPSDKRGMVGYGNYETAMDTLELAVRDKRYIAGDTFTAADVYLGSQISWGLMFETIPKRPAFEAYWNGLKDRPAAVRAREIDDALIPKRG